MYSFPGYEYIDGCISIFLEVSELEIDGTSTEYILSAVDIRESRQARVFFKPKEALALRICHTVHLFWRIQ